MKTMKLGDQIKRVKEKEVIKMRKVGWDFCPKSEWKEKVRAFQKPAKTEKTEKDVTEKKKGKQNLKGKAKKTNQTYYKVIYRGILEQYSSFLCGIKNNNQNMTNHNNWKWKATKIGPMGEHSEELTYKQITEMLLSGNFMLMIKRMKIGEELFYNENNIKYLRIE